MAKHLIPFRQRATGALAVIRDGIRALAPAMLWRRAKHHASRVRMFPIYDRTDVSYIDEHGTPHLRHEDDWIGVAWYLDGQLLHEIRWGSPSPPEGKPKHLQGTNSLGPQP